jgi:hypothetical protein
VRSYRNRVHPDLLIVPTLRVVMQPATLCVENRTRSVNNAVTTRSVGTINFYDCCAADRGLALLVRSYSNRVHPDL